MPVKRTLVDVLKNTASLEKGGYVVIHGSRFVLLSPMSRANRSTYLSLETFKALLKSNTLKEWE